MECRESDTSLVRIVIAITETYLDEKNIERDTFVKQDLLPVLVRSGLLDEPGEAKRYNTWANNQCKKIERLIKGETAFKADWVMPWISALPEPYLGKAMNEVCGFFGTYFTPMTLITGSVNKKSVKSGLSHISQEFADVLQKSIAVMDGMIDENDSDADLQQYANEVHELVAASISELGRLYKARGILPAAHIAMANSPLFQIADK
ncbi:hypothetical protein F7Q91_19100 [Vibrio chagasii]|uniref:Uncharacterized protein n=1 Tax=Vibrio chagasii TaxID=170679 RepID=A0A7V7NR93_9VIBR|nr:hypothetical protein [Vibrio chagasii]KAB0476548.1 hypothetical protein F7Q91_19100 [Vibrio chagasii]